MTASSSSRGFLQPGAVCSAACFPCLRAVSVCAGKGRSWSVVGGYSRRHRPSVAQARGTTMGSTWTGNGNRLEAGAIRGERRYSTCTPGRSGAVSPRPGHHLCPHPVPREPSSSWKASTSLQWALQQEVASLDLGGRRPKGGNPLGSSRERQRGTPGPLLPPKANARSQPSGCEPATACLEGRWSQDHRLLVGRQLRHPAHQSAHQTHVADLLFSSGESIVSKAL